MFCWHWLLITFEQYTLNLNFLSGGQKNIVQNTFPLSHDTKTDIGHSETDFEDMAMIRLDAMQRANSTLEDFVSNSLFLRCEILVIPYSWNVPKAILPRKADGWIDFRFHIRPGSCVLFEYIMMINWSDDWTVSILYQLHELMEILNK